MKKLLILLCIIPAGLMAQYSPPQTVNIGSSANDGTGDPLRTAMNKLNINDGAAYDTLYNIRTVTDNHETRLDSLEAYRVTELGYYECAANDTTYINIGVTTNGDVAFSMNYLATRNISGVLNKEFGPIHLLYDSASGTVKASSTYIGYDQGITIDGDLSGTNIRLMVIVDNVSAGAAYLSYRIIHKFYE